MDSSELRQAPNPPRNLFEELRSAIHRQKRNYVTPRELGVLIDLDYHTIRQKIVSGVLKATEVRGRYRIYEEEVKRFLEDEGYITLKREQPSVRR